MTFLKTSLIFLLSIGLISESFADNHNWQAGARSAAMGNSSLSNIDVWAGFNNPAAMTGISHISGGIYYENRFLVSELSSAALAFVLPTNSGNWGLIYSRFGYSLYNENRIGIAYAMPLADWLSLGIQFDYFNTVQPEAYGNKHVLSFDIGLLANPVENFYFGAHIFNPANISTKGEIDRDIPTALRLGIAQQFSENTKASIEAETDMQTYTILKAGVEYQLHNHFFVMTGINVKPIRASFGAAYQNKSIRIDMAYSYHQQLGNSPHIGISYAF
jgi:hypothetical protein